MEKYVMDKEIGKGAFGKIYKVRTNTGKTIAVKVIDFKTPELLNTAMREVEYLKIISEKCQPSLICYYDSFISNNKLYIETEYIEGVTLTRFSNNNRYKEKFPEHLLAIVKDIVPGLQYLHLKNILHRDIKPDNIMIQIPNFQPKLIDVGLACFYKKDDKCIFQEECCVNKVGTPFFMAPETLLDGQSYISTDIWALGASIHYAATKRHVYEPKTYTVEGIVAQMEEPLFLIKTKNDKLNILLEMMLEPDPNDRISLSKISSYLS